MVLIACTDNKGTMRFNKRRVSQDSVIIDDILDISGNWLKVFPYSYELFSSVEQVSIVQSYDSLSAGDIFFAEQSGLEVLRDRVHTLVIYDWGVTYPKGEVFDFALTDFTLVEEKKIKGSSHEEVIRRTYRHV